MKKPLLFFLSFYLFTHSSAQLIGPQGGKSFGNAILNGSNQSWVNTINAAASDDQYVTFGNLDNTIGSHTDYLLAAGFGFNLPQGATITGIAAYIECSDPNAGTADYSVRILKNGVVGTTERSAGALYLQDNGQDTYHNFGGNGDLWGETWTTDDIKAKTFGVAVAAQRAVLGKSTDGRIDNIRLAVYFFTPVTLPLNLTAFSAVLKKDMVRVEWTTTDESGMDRFEIQRSTDGTEFKSFGTMLCRNQVTEAIYAFNDYAPFTGNSYYRLKILEKSGSVAYSKIATIQFKSDNPSTLFPSPWKKGQSLFIRNPANGKLVIQFFNESGEMVAKVSTSSGQVVMPALPDAGGILRYKVFDEKEKMTGFGSLLVY